MADIKEVIILLENYVKLEKNIEVLTRTKGMSQDILGESQDYRALINLGAELKNYVLNGGEIIKIYKRVKDESNSAKENYEKTKNSLDSIISDLNSTMGNKKGEFIDEIRQIINKYKQLSYEQT